MAPPAGRHSAGQDDVRPGPAGQGSAGRDSTPQDDGDIRLSARVFGVVQGVGFRFWTMGKAEELGLTGLVKNLDDGSVSVIAEGPQHRIQELLDWLNSDNTPGRVERVEDTLSAAEGAFRGFRAR
ncbi:acylphosphatase [Arthrobacter sp. BE255]|uniref:acylphosphatase n=1 Tax=Arthrobacter sp. BE255 TaxID=2817721 RepID=UPI00286682DE|nr:acylphosphatase [Arthrobacter sp. BE255]MDR7160608.1 acylphosphatase [Arthrobacter sp. BE255]